MLYYNFKNYDGFKDLFGTIKHGNNTQSRKNRILLAYLKDRKLLHQAAAGNNYSFCTSAAWQNWSSGCRMKF